MNQSNISRAALLCALNGALLLPAVAAAAADAVPVAPAAYTAETTYKKLAPAYPFIRIASSQVPPSVEALKDITYASYRDRTLQLDLYLPTARAGKSAPGIVFVHGGGWRSGVRENFAPMAIRMAQRGYAAATISYRLSGEATYPAAIHDVKAAIRWMRTNAARYGIDQDKIAVAGGSAGGQIASLTGVTNGIARFDPGAGAGAVSSAAQAIVNIDGLSDFTSEEARKDEDNPAKQPTSAGAWLGGRYAEKSALWHEASPTFYVNKKTPPILFIGSGQARFSVGRDAMIDKMKAAGVASRVLLMPDTPHSFWLLDPWLEPTVDATVSFLDHHFGRAPAPSRQAMATPCLPVGELIERDRQYEEALRVGDGAFLQSWLADDYVWVHNLGSQIETKPIVLARSQKPTVVPKSRATHDVQGQTLGDTTVLRGLSTVEQWNPDGKTWRSNRYQFMRTYVNVGGTCKLLAVQTMKVWSSPK